MALLSIEKRKKFFETLGLGEYNKENTKKLQKKYMLRKSDVDGVYGEDTDNLLRHLILCKRHLNPATFKPEEFRCGCGGRHCCGYPTYMKAKELQNVQRIRDHYGKSMIITCGLRCPAYNREVGGIPNSEHKNGLAVDFYIRGVTDTYGNRKESIRWMSRMPNHHYTYGDGIYAETANGKTTTGYVSAPGMGNAMHTDAREIESSPKSVYKVIDVSEFQGKINWKKVKADGIVGAIIRFADGDYIDKYFEENMKGAKAAGLHVGAYIFSRAKTETQARKEAKRLYAACAKYEPDMPLYIDLEAKGLEKTADANAQAFLAKMDELGAKGGVYASVSWWNSYLKKTAELNRPMWVAQYYSRCQYEPLSRVGIWQYTSKGSVKGISGNVDRDECYVAYWK